MEGCKSNAQVISGAGCGYGDEAEILPWDKFPSVIAQEMYRKNFHFQARKFFSQTFTNAPTKGEIAVFVPVSGTCGTESLWLESGGIRIGFWVQVGLGNLVE
jgi:hypothetical protein